MKKMLSILGIMMLLFTTASLADITPRPPNVIANSIQVTGDGTIWSTGIYGITPISGEGTRFMWVPSKSALRAGGVVNSEWDAANIGQYSTALGMGTKASGTYSYASGAVTEASGTASVAQGQLTKASGYGSFVAGRNYNFAQNSFVAGNGVANEGEGQIAMGLATAGNTLKAEKTGSVAIGQDVNAISNPNVMVLGRGFSSNVQDSLTIGFGSRDYMFSANSMDIYSGNELHFLDSDGFYAGFKTAQLNDNVVWTLPTHDGLPGQVLSTDGNGNLVWVTVSSKCATVN